MLMRKGLNVLINKMLEVLKEFVEFVRKPGYSSRPTVGIAGNEELTTVGKRATIWIQVRQILLADWKTNHES